MLKFLLVFFLSIFTYNLIRAHRDPHLCRQPVVISYTEEVNTPLAHYGKFAEYYQKMNISGHKKNVTKTRTEMREICCPGYIMSPDGNGDCQPLLPSTTTKATTMAPTMAPTTTSTDTDTYTDDTETSTDSTSWSSTSWDDSSTDLHTTTVETPTEKPGVFQFFDYAPYVLGSILIILLVLTLVYCKRTQKKYLVQRDNHQVIFEAEAHRTLIQPAHHI